jgi:hypothetical protein
MLCHAVSLHVFMLRLTAEIRGRGSSLSASGSEAPVSISVVVILTELPRHKKQWIIDELRGWEKQINWKQPRKYGNKIKITRRILRTRVVSNDSVFLPVLRPVVLNLCQTASR